MVLICWTSGTLMSNYTNHFAQTPIDSVFEKFAWARATVTRQPVVEVPANVPGLHASYSPVDDVTMTSPTMPLTSSLAPLPPATISRVPPVIRTQIVITIVADDGTFWIGGVLDSDSEELRVLTRRDRGLCTRFVTRVARSVS